MKCGHPVLAHVLVSGVLLSAPCGVVGYTEAEPAAVSKRDVPLSLTASDGTGLRLVVLEADGVLEPPLAFTELRLTFENPDERVVEGTFRLRLPPRAVQIWAALPPDQCRMIRWRGWILPCWLSYR